jgi:hypothetical protein
MLPDLIKRANAYETECKRLILANKIVQKLERIRLLEQRMRETAKNLERERERAREISIAKDFT